MLLPPLLPQFENLEHANCLGADSSKWKASFNGHMSNVTLSNDGNAVSSFKTPLKVTHAEDCGTVAPALTLQMDTTVDGDLAISGDLVTGLLNGQPAGSGYAMLKCRGSGSGVFGGDEANRNGKPAKQKCATSANGNSIEMHTCNLDQNEKQLSWYGKMLRYRNNQCWKVRMSDGKVEAASYCNNDEGGGDSTHAEEMYFHFDGEQIKNQASTVSNTRWHDSVDGNYYCMQCGPDPVGEAHNGEVWMKPCDGSDNQRWFWWRPGDPNP